MFSIANLGQVLGMYPNKPLAIRDGAFYVYIWFALLLHGSSESLHYG